MRKESKDLLETFLTFQEYHLNEARRAWDTAVQRIRDNPNQMNPQGVWQREQLADLETLRVLIADRDRLCRELRSFIDKPKNRFQYPKKVKKSERRALKRNERELGL
jgi:hypothetical protein